jgi:membrane-associated phospholipid phosphatase
VAVATAFSREYPEYRAPVLLAAAIVAGAQVPRRAHYPSDLAAGAVIGAAAELLANSVWTSGRG